MTYTKLAGDEFLSRTADKKRQRGEKVHPSWSQDTLALAFAGKHADSLRYVAAWGKWLSWDDTRWRADDTLHTFDRIRNLCREAGNKANAQMVAAVERLSKSDRRLAATADQWDRDPWLLNTPGGTVDLRTGELRPHTRGDHMTKVTTVAPAPPGTSPVLWLKFLDRITAGDADLVAFLQRYVGYSCTGLTDEHVLAFGHGTGANGKSTFVNVIAGILADYATVAAMETFLETRSERHPTDVAKLHGARLVTAQETQKGRRWDETKIKTLTGGDKQTARFMRADFFDFVPTFKLLMSGNHKPRLSSIDEAIRRRFLLIPFTVAIPAAERDPELPRKLRSEWPAILRWMLDGCLQWQQHRLDVPPSVRDTTANYFEDQDTLGQWIDECIMFDPMITRRTRDLFTSWKAWCECRSLRAGSEKSFVESMEAKGLHKRRDRVGRSVFDGVDLKSQSTV